MPEGKIEKKIWNLNSNDIVINGWSNFIDSIYLNIFDILLLFLAYFKNYNADKCDKSPSYLFLRKFGGVQLTLSSIFYFRALVIGVFLQRVKSALAYKSKLKKI